MYLITQSGLIIKKKWRELVYKNILKDNIKMNFTPKNKEMTLKEAKMIMKYKGPEADEFNRNGKKEFGFFSL